jgi:hypothetical protein
VSAIPGPGPINRRPSCADGLRVSIAVDRYVATDGHTASGGRFPRPSHPKYPMTTTNPRTGPVQQSIANSTYVVDAAQVADAILRRLLDGRSI